MLAVKERADVFVDDENSSDICGSYEPVDSLEQLYRMLQESEESVAQGRVFTKEEVLKSMEMALNS